MLTRENCSSENSNPGVKLKRRALSENCIFIGFLLRLMNTLDRFDAGLILATDEIFVLQISKRIRDQTGVCVIEYCS